MLTLRTCSLRAWLPNSPSILGSTIMLSSWSIVSNHHSLGPVALETLKAYLEANLANRFIRPSKSPVGAPIFFDRRSDGSSRLYVWGFNNLTIKNRYRCLRLRRYLLGQNVNFDRRRFASKIGRVHPGRPWPEPKSI